MKQLEHSRPELVSGRECSSCLGRNYKLGFVNDEVGGVIFSNKLITSKTNKENAYS